MKGNDKVKQHLQNAENAVRIANDEYFYALLASKESDWSVEEITKCLNMVGKVKFKIIGKFGLLN